MAQHPISLTMMNRIYVRLSYRQKSVIHEHFARIFRGANGGTPSGDWMVRFLGRRLSLPMRREETWLDWDTALSILGHDVEVKETYQNLISEHRPDVFLDIGANYGTHSLLFLIHGVQTITFEPNSTCHRYFSEACALNGLKGQIEKVALGDIGGRVTLKYPKEETWLGATDADTQARIGKERQLVAEDVEQRQLDSYLATLAGRRVLIKIDTEGNEYKVLLGAKQILLECRPLVIFEDTYTTSRGPLFELFSASKYEICELPWSPRAYSEPLSGDEFVSKRSTNFIAVPR
jgi:FkbM family methyltransferase